MATLMVWVWKSKQVPGPLRSGHAELYLDGMIYCHRQRLPAKIKEEADDEWATVFEGRVSERHLDDLERAASRVFGKRAKFLELLPPPQAVTFVKEISSDLAKALKRFLKAKIADPPDYCPVSKSATKNCATFSLWALGESGILPEDLQPKGRMYLPDLFLKAMHSLFVGCFFDTYEERLLDEEWWKVQNRYTK
jgi:hypothetical protein